MKEYEIGDVIPIYEVPLNRSFQLEGSSTKPQQVPVNPNAAAFGLIDAHFIVFNKGTDYEHSDCAVFQEDEVKLIGQMRIKKLK